MIDLGEMVTSAQRPVFAAGNGLGGKNAAAGDAFGAELRRAMEGRQEAGKTDGKPVAATQRPAAAERPDEPAARAEGERRVKSDKAKVIDAEAQPVSATETDEAVARAQIAQLAAIAAEETAVEEVATEEWADVEEIQNLLEARMAALEAQQGRVPAADEEAPEMTFEGETVPELALPEVPVADSGTAFDMLTPEELAAPDLHFDMAPERLLEKLQQAVGQSAGAAGLEEAAEIVLPQVVRGMASLVRNGMAEMRLQLQPADLGEIELRVKAAEGAVRGEMIVQHPEVKQLLESQLERLRTALGESGLELEGFDVDVSSGERGREPEEQETGRQGRSSTPVTPTEPTAPVLRTGPVLGSDAAVDYVV